MSPTSDSLLPNPATPADVAAQVTRVVVFFETLTPQSVAMLSTLYDPAARFKDPFNEVVGITAIAPIFMHMFVALEAPRFIVTQQVVQDSQCFLTWEFRFRFKNFAKDTEQTIRGGSHLQFSAQGLVTLHRDYWDAAEELYEKLPLIGRLMRWLKQRANS
ncbi:MAG: hypothetical protein ACJA2P_001444 [Rhodoferax sp.]|jgi:hypothetical protein